ncbi:MAG: phosphoribosylaminoimidazolesuccinocarboxamide synthase [Hyphomicrobiales bacterium]|nr:phosphoribosylaminoimidazolesuccinocarboxamide synthase [Rickettsiales bacterium]MCP5361320.1 phosphoribosylaminoimidazolesuccinocarboxamide synthase [Hyphomicrobiales bacterium]
MTRSKPLYEGKAKILYEGPEPGTLIQYFKDDATAFNNKKKGVIPGKGILNNRISEFIMSHLHEVGIHTHFIKSLNMREQLIKAAEVIPVEVVVRNVTAGSLCKRFDVEEGMMLPAPLVEYYLKSDALNDPMLTEEHIVTFGWAFDEELDEIKAVALRVNDFLTGLFLGVGLKLVDFKLEFGRWYDEEGNLYIILADEISPDSCRLWDVETGEKMDKDRFRHDLGKVAEAYQEVARRLGIFMDTQTQDNVAEFKPKESAKPKTSGTSGMTKGKPAKKKADSTAGKTGGGSTKRSTKKSKKPKK